MEIIWQIRESKYSFISHSIEHAPSQRCEYQPSIVRSYKKLCQQINTILYQAYRMVSQEKYPYCSSFEIVNSQMLDWSNMDMYYLYLVESSAAQLLP